MTPEEVSPGACFKVNQLVAAQVACLGKSTQVKILRNNAQASCLQTTSNLQNSSLIVLDTSLLSP